MRHLFLLGMSFLVPFLSTTAQNPTSCASVGSRANSNGQATSCPNAGGGTVAASNFSGTPYAAPPASSKTGNLKLVYAGAGASLLPFAITRTWATTTGGVTTLTTVAFGPAGPPVVNGSNAEVDYCFYNTNLATIGTLSFEFTNPQTGAVWGICSFDAGCTSGCTVVATPPGVLPVTFSGFRATPQAGRAALLEWTTATEQNNKGYTVERSIDGAPFEAIGFIPSSNPGGNSSIPSRYSYNDLNIPGGQNIGYRLRQEDLDGAAAYSEIRLLQLKAAGDGSGNPGNGTGIYCDGATITITFPETKTTRNIFVHDTEGRAIRQFRVSAARQYRITDLPAGHLYYILVREDGNTPPTVKSVFLSAR